MMTHDTNHVTEALSRLLEQYKGKPNIQALITAIVTQVQLLEDQFWNLITQRMINGASGIQLDLLGEIVGITRNGLVDSQYQLRILARIQVNVSAGTPESLIYIYKLLTGASTVYLEEQFPGDIALYSDGSIASGQNYFIDSLMELAASAGVRVAFLGQYDPSNPFSFDGTLTPSGGFGDATDSTKGGVLGQLYVIGPYFAMAGDDPLSGGFSSLTDSVEGGYFSV